MSRRRTTAILSAVRSLPLIAGPFGIAVALIVSATLIVAPLPRARAATSAPSRTRDDYAARRAVPAATTTHFLRDAVPASGFAAAPEDTTDEEFLPEEGDTKKLVWDIAAWVIGAALVAFFIIKVFIEEDQDEPEEGGGTKPDPF